MARFYPRFIKEDELQNDPTIDTAEKQNNRTRKQPERKRCLPLGSEASCGLFDPENYFEIAEELYWKEVSPEFGRWKLNKRSKKIGSEMLPLYTDNEKNEYFAPNPNLYLNIGISKPTPALVGMFAAFGVLLQLSFIGFAAWATYVARLLKDGSTVPAWAFPVATTVFWFVVIE